MQDCLKCRSQPVLIYFVRGEQEHDQNVNTPFRKKVLRIERGPTPRFFATLKYPTE